MNMNLQDYLSVSPSLCTSRATLSPWREVSLITGCAHIHSSMAYTPGPFAFLEKVGICLHFAIIELSGA
jgi:hypothetical protein